MRKKTDKDVCGAYMYINNHTPHNVEDNILEDEFRFYENGTSFRSVTPDELLQIAEEERSKREMANKKISSVNLEAVSLFVDNATGTDAKAPTRPQKAVKGKKVDKTTSKASKAENKAPGVSVDADNLIKQILDLPEEDKKTMSKLYGIKIPGTERKTARFDALMKPSTITALEEYCQKHNRSKSSVAEDAILEYISR